MISRARAPAQALCREPVSDRTSGDGRLDVSPMGYDWLPVSGMDSHFRADRYLEFYSPRHAAAGRNRVACARNG